VRLPRAAEGLGSNRGGFTKAACTANPGGTWRSTIGLALVSGMVVGAAHATESAAVAAGREIAHDVYKGNCLACHRIPGDPSAVTLANIGPPIVQMRERFPDRAELRRQIWDSTARNPQSVMPPFGKHGVLTEREIDLVIEYIYRY
jgi:sulfur-oxidizing protein SoxX